MCVLINSSTFVFLKKVPTLEQAEAWASKLIPETEDYHIVSGEGEVSHFRAYTATELRQFCHHAGIKLPIDRLLGKEELMAKVAAFPAGMDLDSTQVEDIKALAPVVSKAEAKPREPKQGGSRPAAGTVTGKVWDIADQLTASGGSKASILAACTEAGVNLATAKTQYARWLKLQLQ